MPTEADIAWAAGLFEGEGCFSIHKDHHTVIATIGSTDEDVLIRFHTIVGMGRMRRVKPHRGTKPHHKQMFHWWASGIDAENVVRLLLPQLGLRRTATITEILERREAHRAASTRERVCKGCGTPFSPEWGPMAARSVFCTDACRNRYGSRRIYWTRRALGTRSQSERLF